ncbi:MAG: ParB N-terminal domain-containing protein [Chloroflexi bacterium]|nr:ParB N-terminal domain-containing protein [Chloroflexota bacterium]MBP8059631.1 ParB N-terminal domain-containing protein [Chloroflexota bacterium]
MSKKRQPTSGIAAIMNYQGNWGGAEIKPDEIQAEKLPLDPNRPRQQLATMSIRPDPEQPRQLMPPALYEQMWTGSAPTFVLRQWLDLANQETTSPAQKRAVTELKELARTIAAQGLIHPIVVRDLPDELKSKAARGVEKLVVAGERRWWAHVLLVLQGGFVAGEQAPDQIDVTYLAPNVRVRAVQLIENIFRSDLNALERAEGLIALREELTQMEGETVPWTQVESLLGIDRPYRWRIEQVLTLSPQAQEIVRWHGLAEKAIRPVATKLKERPELQIMALRRLVDWQEAGEESGNKRLADYVETLLKGKAEPNNAPIEVNQIKRSFQQKVGAILQVINALDDEALMQMAEWIRQDIKVRQSLNALREKLDRVLD